MDATKLSTNVRKHQDARVHITKDQEDSDRFTLKVPWEVVRSQTVNRCSVVDLGQDSPVLCLHESFCSKSICTPEISRTSFELLVSCFLLKALVLNICHLPTPTSYLSCREPTVRAVLPIFRFACVFG